LVTIAKRSQVCGLQAAGSVLGIFPARLPGVTRLALFPGRVVGGGFSGFPGQFVIGYGPQTRRLSGEAWLAISRVKVWVQRPARSRGILAASDGRDWFLHDLTRAAWVGRVAWRKREVLVVEIVDAGPECLERSPAADQVCEARRYIAARAGQPAQPGWWQQGSLTEPPLLPRWTGA
jgi:hypothetical protein